MRIKIILFGILKVWANVDEIECELGQPDPTVDDAYTKLCDLVGLSRERLDQVAAAVGEELVPRSHPLRGGDVVMLLPPVSGG